MTKEELKEQADPHCPDCHGTGTRYEGNGDDDVNPIMCDCITHS